MAKRPERRNEINKRQREGWGREIALAGQRRTRKAHYCGSDFKITTDP